MENDAALVALSEDMASALRRFELPDAEETEGSDDDIRQLLRWLNNLPSADMALDEWLDAGTPDEAIAKATNLSQLVKLFIRKLKRARKKRADILREEAMIEDAVYAAAAMTQAVIDYTLSKQPHPGLEAALKALPPQAEMRQAQSVKRLVETLAAAMERASGKNVSGKTAPERLVESSVRIEKTARTLQSVDTLKPPAREESIELAREILRRLKNMSFSDKSMKEIIDTGRPEEKAVFAQQIDEMTDMYANLVQEAAESNPNIMQDQRIKEASDAVSTFAHGVTLMAAKEVPGSIAAAQQISADVTQNPAEWSRLHDRTVGRLLKSMEGGLEKAVGDIQAEQGQQEDQQVAQEAAMEAALHHADQSRRKKRKRRGGGKSGTSAGKKQAKQAHASDAKVLRETNMVNVVHGLNAEAMAAVKQLGGALLNIGKQAKDIAATDKIAPDDKSASQRIIDDELRKGPKNQGPRV